MQEVPVRSLVWEDPTCCGTAKPVHYSIEPVLQSLGTTTAEPSCHTCWSPCSPTRGAATMRNPQRTMKSSPCSPQLEESPCSKEDPAQPKINKIKKQQRKQSWLIARCPGECLSSLGAQRWGGEDLKDGGDSRMESWGALTSGLSVWDQGMGGWGRQSIQRS